MMGHIFISYSHKDKEYVHKLQEALQNEGFDVWIDDRIDYGTEWPKVIQKHLDECAAFVVVVSENAFESKWVQNEVARASRKNKPFFPLLLSGDPWLSVETVQYVDVRNGLLPSDKFFERLRNKTPHEEVSTVLPNKVIVDTLFNEATQFSLSGNLERALQLYKQIKQIEPSYPNIDLYINRIEPKDAKHHLDDNGQINSNKQAELQRGKQRNKRLTIAALILAIAIISTLLISKLTNNRNLPPPLVSVNLITPTFEPITIYLFTATVPVSTTTPECIPIVTVSTSINIRIGPGTEYSRVGYFMKGDSALLVGKNYENTWWYIQYSENNQNQYGWVSASLVMLSCIPQNIPILPTPSLIP